MLLRVKTSVIALLLLFAVLWASETAVFELAMAAVAAIAAFEVVRAAGLGKNRLLACAVMLIAAAFAFVRLCPEGGGLFLCGLLAAVLAAFAIFMPSAVAADRMSVVFTYTMIIAAAAASIVAIRRMEGGGYFIVLMFMIPWVSDSLAYICGSRFGKRKLCPDISPNKTVAGFVCGMLGGAVSALIFGLIVYIGQGRFPQATPALMLIGTVCSLLGQAGDLVFSIAKRYFGIKDYGRLFPGHGGMCDRFDSVFFVAPALFFFLWKSGITL